MLTMLVTMYVCIISFIDWNIRNKCLDIHKFVAFYILYLSNLLKVQNIIDSPELLL
jgi:hypothetical protein